MNRFYWPATALFAAALSFSAVMHGFQIGPMLESMTALGYPPYFMTILGAAKLLGVVTLLAPGFPLLKEWAYAGFCFNLIGAVSTHAFAGDPIAEVAQRGQRRGAGRLDEHLHARDQRPQ